MNQKTQHSKLQEEGQTNQIHYKQIQTNFKWFFQSRTTLLIILTFLMVLYFNDIPSIIPQKVFLPISQNTVKHINHLIQQASGLLSSTSKSLAVIVDNQYENVHKYGQTYYKDKQLTKVQKMVYKQKYNTTGEYTCLYGYCTSISSYLTNLWSKRIFYKSVQTIYVSYYDPLQGMQNIAITPSNSNQLSQDQIRSIFAQSEQQVNIHKVRNDLYIHAQYNLPLGSNSTYQIKSMIKLKKSQYRSTLQKDIELNKFYDYQLSDSLGWISFTSISAVPFFSSRQGKIRKEMPYIDQQSNKTLITFYFDIPIIKIYFDYLMITLLLPVLILIFQIFKQRDIYRNGLKLCFYNTQQLVSLYQFNINEIFTGNQPTQTTILNSTSTTEFYQELSQIPSTDYQPITHMKKDKVQLKKFLFQDTIKKVVEKYNNYAKYIFREKNKQIISNKFFIHSSINEISEAQSSKIKQVYFQSKELGLVQPFFKFAYLSILLNPETFDITLEQDKSPLPDECIKAIRQMNRTVSGPQVRRAFKLSSHVRKQTEEQLQMRIQINLLQKYMQLLKQLDIHAQYAKELQLEPQLENINQYIQNIKHILNKHNKNIRTMGK